jgi:hypothetical protein
MTFDSIEQVLLLDAGVIALASVLLAIAFWMTLN